MKKFFTLTALLLCAVGGAMAAESAPTYAQPTSVLDISSKTLGTTLSGVAWSDKNSNYQKMYNLTDDNLILPLVPLVYTVDKNAWSVQENSRGNTNTATWSASEPFEASSYYMADGKTEVDVPKLTTTRMVAVKVKGCTGAYLYAAANVVLNVYKVTDDAVAYNTLTSAGSATTTAANGVVKVTGLDATETYIVQVIGSTSKNANAYALALQRDSAPRTAATKNDAVSDQHTVLYNNGTIGDIVDNTCVYSFSENHIAIVGSGANEKIFEAGSNNYKFKFTETGDEYAAVKVKKNCTYVIKPNAGITISSVVAYATSNSDNQTSAITSGTIDNEELATRGVSATPIVPASFTLQKNADGNYYFTIGGVASQAIIVLDVIYSKVENIDVKVSDAGYATLFYDKKLAIPEGVTAYSATVKDASTITLTAIDGVIPASTGVILKADEGTYNFVVTEDAAPTIGSNILAGTTTATTKAALGGTVYTLGQNDGGVVGLRNYTGDDIRAYSAYTTSISAAPFFSFDFGEGTTGINVVKSVANDNVYYNLKGQRVAQPSKGLYIVNGKKVIIK